MAQHNNANHTNNINNIASQQLQQQQEQKQQQQQQQQELVKVKPVFHDFLGRKKNPITESSVLLAPKAVHVSRTSDPDPSFSSTTDIDSERQEGNHLEGVPFYGLRREFSGSEISKKLARNNISNSTFLGSSRDAFQMGPESLQNSHLLKIVRNAAGGERLRRSNDDEVFLGMPSRKPCSGPQIFQSLPATKIDANIWEQSILMNEVPSMQHQPHGRQAPFAHHVTSNKMKDTNAGPSFISQLAADEGSRTGIKGTGILNSINATNAAMEKTSSAELLGGSRTNPMTNIIDPESSTLLSQRGTTRFSCQMTIFYGGQAHVFDDVQPNKADVIMDLAGSNGGSWSTTFSPKSAVKLVHDSKLLVGENKTAIASNVALPQDCHARLPITGSSTHAIGPGDRLTTAAGAHQGSIVTKDRRNPVQAENTSSGGKRA